MNEWSKAQEAGKGDLFQLTIDEPQRWGTRVFGLGRFLENHRGDTAVLKILRLEIKAANVSLPVSKVNSLAAWAQGQILSPSSDGTDWPPLHPDTPLVKMIALTNSSHQLVQQADTELGRDCWICLRTSQVSYAGVGLTNTSEIHELGLDNSTQNDNTCLTGPVIQIIGEN
jgi:hypothetical protein